MVKCEDLLKSGLIFVNGDVFLMVLLIVHGGCLMLCLGGKIGTNQQDLA